MAMWHDHRKATKNTDCKAVADWRNQIPLFRAVTPKADLFTSGQRCPHTNTISAIISITDGTADHASVARETMLGLTIELLRLYGTVK